MDFMFSNCQKLKYLNLSSFITSSCTSMKYMFNNCTELVFVDISNYDTSYVSNMDYMFHNCKKLKASINARGGNQLNPDAIALSQYLTSSHNLFAVSIE